jgi:crotonobetainyl-CoA:carnitine CoA-transferase CaiB-like acyl-CoA transferase
VKVVGPPAVFSDSPVGIQSPPPMLGEHNREILTGILGYSDDEIEQLRQKEAI